MVVSSGTFRPGCALEASATCTLLRLLKGSWRAAYIERELESRMQYTYTPYLHATITAFFQQFQVSQPFLKISKKQVDKPFTINSAQNRKN